MGILFKADISTFKRKRNCCTRDFSFHWEEERTSQNLAKTSISGEMLYRKKEMPKKKNTFDHCLQGPRQVDLQDQA